MTSSVTKKVVIPSVLTAYMPGSKTGYLKNE